MAKPEESYKIYMIKDKNGKKFIGGTKVHMNAYIQNFITYNNYGFDEDSITIELLEECPPNIYKERKQYYIDINTDCCNTHRNITDDRILSYNKEMSEKWRNSEKGKSNLLNYKRSERGRAASKKYYEANKKAILLRSKKNYENKKEEKKEQSLKNYYSKRDYEKSWDAHNKDNNNLLRINLDIFKNRLN
jgi:hypothetical protein